MRRGRPRRFPARQHGWWQRSGAGGAGRCARCGAGSPPRSPAVAQRRGEAGRLQALLRHPPWAVFRAPSAFGWTPSTAGARGLLRQSGVQGAGLGGTLVPGGDLAARPGARPVLPPVQARRLPGRSPGCHLTSLRRIAARLVLPAPWARLGARAAGRFVVSSFSPVRSACEAADTPEAICGANPCSTPTLRLAPRTTRGTWPCFPSGGHCDLG